VPLLRPFGVAITAYSAGVPAALMQEAGIVPAASLAALFAGSEVLFECEALTPATESSVTAEHLARLPDDAVFVNVGRGQLVDELALAREARSGRLRLALDVVNTEPLTADSPFFGLPNVMLSPHIAGPTGDRYRQCGDNALANLAAFLRGETPPAQITLASYDRAT
jgi:phosphoglycerate dehydrogenase-like enzyme